jgi:hypothetical protein
MDEFGPDEQKWLDVLRSSDEPSTDDRARVRAAILAGIASGAATATATTAAAAAAKSSAVAKTGLAAMGWKVGAAAVVLVAGAAVSAVALRGPTSTMLPPPSAPSTVVVAAAPPTELAPPPVTAASPDIAAPPKPVASTRSPARVSPPSRPAGSDDDVDAELVVIARAQRALERGDAEEALVQLAHHGREHPKGALALEREGLRAIASCDAKRSDGRALATRFIAAHPTSPLVTRIRTSCLSP